MILFAIQVLNMGMFMLIHDLWLHMMMQEHSLTCSSKVNASQNIRNRDAMVRFHCLFLSDFPAESIQVSYCYIYILLIIFELHLYILLCL